MPILLIQRKATKEEIQEMLKALESYIKVAVDISEGILAGGGSLHADWDPKTKKVTFEAMINLAPRRKNRSMEIQNPAIQEKVEKTIRNLLQVE